MDFKLYSSRDRFPKSSQLPPTRYYVLQGIVRWERGRETGIFLNWHVVLETPDLDLAWASCPRPGLVMSREEMTSDPVVKPLLDSWMEGDDRYFQEFNPRWWLDGPS